MVLMIDNYDSFTYNLVQYLGMLGARVKVYRNDMISVETIKRMRPAQIVISPGPGRPEDAGVSCEVITAFMGKIPVLGVCLGHQAIGYALGGRIVRAKKLMHGKTSRVYHSADRLFTGIPNPFEATRYHSLVVDRKNLPSSLVVTAWTRDKEIMGITHKRYPLWGVQFHPESVLTGSGLQILKNFLNL